MEQTITVSIQDYLKNIYELTENGDSASTTALAQKMNVRAPSVTGMVQKMASAKPPLVEYQKHQGVTLTRVGNRAALEVIRHHRLLEAWLEPVPATAMCWGVPRIFARSHGPNPLRHIIAKLPTTIALPSASTHTSCRP